MTHKSDALSPSELERINHHSMMNYDKWHRMFCGLSSHLDKYENGIINLKIWNTEAKFLSNYETALDFAQRWIRWNSELKDAKGFVVAFYRTRSTGFMVKMADTDKSHIQELVQELQSKGQEDELVNIFSGLI